MSLPIIVFFTGLYLIPYLYRNKHFSAYSYLQEKFGMWAVYFSEALAISLHISRMAIILFLISQVVILLVPLSFYQVVLSVALCIFIYSFFGGFKAVVQTDAIQVFLVIFGGLLILLYLLFLTDTDYMKVISEHPSKISMKTGGFSLFKKSFFTLFMFGFIDNMMVFNTDQSVVQRLLAANSVAKARKSLAIGVSLILGTMLLFTLLGTFLFCYYSSTPEILLIKDSSNILIHFIQSIKHKPVQQIVLLSIVSAALSSIDSSLNSVSVLIANRLQATSKNKLQKKWDSSLKARYSTLFSILIATCLCLFFERNSSVLDIWWTVAAFFGFGIFSLFCLSHLKVNLSGRQFIFVSLIVYPISLLIVTGRTPLDPLNTSLFGIVFFVSVSALIGSSRLTA